MMGHLWLVDYADRSIWRPDGALGLQMQHRTTGRKHRVEPGADSADRTNGVRHNIRVLSFTAVLSPTRIARQPQGEVGWDMSGDKYVAEMFRWINAVRLAGRPVGVGLHGSSVLGRFTVAECSQRWPDTTGETELSVVLEERVLASVSYSEADGSLARVITKPTKHKGDQAATERQAVEEWNEALDIQAQYDEQAEYEANTAARRRRLAREHGVEYRARPTDLFSGSKL